MIIPCWGIIAVRGWAHTRANKKFDLAWVKFAPCCVCHHCLNLHKMIKSIWTEPAPYPVTRRQPGLLPMMPNNNIVWQ